MFGPEAAVTTTTTKRKKLFWTFLGGTSVGTDVRT